ncbi:MED1 [Drosophila busckii]|uniref:Mediator of RNA polymerase II transcription subunit 1 n=1 Tax=Drosophila busckii TaxID=30019 RepID=A0A0M4F1N0_DROBS|nr:MED1 [Drosophila busckii]
MSGINIKTSTLAKSAGSGGHITMPVSILIPSIEEKNKQMQQETLMEKLRAKYRNKPKSYDEIKKSVRMYFIEKHYPMDPLCKATLQTALDKLQHYIKVSSRHGLVERLESLSRQLGLKFMEDQQLLFISTDMFYVEILLDASGNLNDVKVHHECKIEHQSSSSSSCSELLNCLMAGDFADFTVQLEGLSSIYQLNAEPKVKKKAFVALQAMETDILTIYQQQVKKQMAMGISDSYHIMNSSSVGLVLPRRGGHPLKLTYFCPPLHLIEASGKIKTEKGAPATSRDFSIDQVMRSTNGLNATLNLEASSANKLQILPIVSFTSESGEELDLPRFCVESLQALGLSGSGNSNEGAKGAGSGSTTVMNLIVQTASGHAIKSTQKGLYVNLPKETHCYFFTDNRRLHGTMLTSLPFTEPAQVAKIIAFLKKQALFYTLLSSCVREQQKQYNDMDSTVILEVTAVSLNQITVELQHPYEESLATIDFLLEDSQPKCTIYCLNNDYEALSDKLTRTVRQVLSIPMVIYKLLKCWDEEHQQKLHGIKGSGPGTGAGSGAGSAIGGGLGASGTSNFRQYSKDSSTGTGGDGSYGASGGFNSVNSMKIESRVRSLADAFAASSSAAAAIAGLISLKQEPVPSVSSRNSDQEIADKYKNIWKDKTPNLKHCVSITPIDGDGKAAPQLPQQQQSSEMQRSGGIEIIPLSAPTNMGNSPGAGSTATTITITPITGSTGGGKEASKEARKIASSGTNSLSSSKRPHDSITSSSSSLNPSSSSGSSSSDSQKEKKRKKKRDDSPMGPPEKIYSRQNSPAAGSITDVSTGTGVARKFSSSSASSSPKAGVTGSSTVGMMGGQSTARPSPKHSPVYSSPKHNSNCNTASNSPKSPFGTQSPKHGSSGKPSMSTLKSATAATSLSPKAEKSSTSTLGVNVGSAGSTPASMSLSISQPSTQPSPSSGPNTSMMRSVPPLANSSNSSSQLSMPMKKDKSISSSSTTGIPGSTSGVVAAAVAALKSSQQQHQQLKSSVGSLSHLAAGGNLANFAPSAVSAMEINALRKSMGGSGVGAGAGGAPSSQEGLKLTINKTGSAGGSISATPHKRESKGASSGSLTSASSGKKQHTGLKPGVNSGPASKKGPSNVSQGSSSSKHLFQKANSSGNLSSKLSSSSSGGGLPLIKSNSTNSFQELGAPRRRPSMSSSGGGAGGNVQRKGSFAAPGSAIGGGNFAASLSGSMSQPPPRFDHHTDMMTILQYASPSMAASMEGFIKGLHNKFQIPKLSQRSSGNNSANDASTTSTSAPSTIQSTTATTTSTIGPSPEEQQQKQLNADLSALAASLTASTSSGGGQQKLSSHSDNDLLLNLSNNAGMGSDDGIDEELLARLAGE